MASVSNGLIVGGGIAGLASAVALQRVGVHCDVVEIGDLAPIGASIGFAGRAPDALEELGIYDELFRTGKPFDAGLKAPAIHDAAGKVLAVPDPPKPIPGAREPVGVHRPLLAEELVKTALSLGARIETGLSIESIDDRDDAAVVRMTNGEVRSYDFVIGADGVGSLTRSLVFPDVPEPEYVGQMSIRWLYPGDPIPGEGWYLAGDYGKIAFYHLPGLQIMYSPMVINMPDRKLSRQEAYEVVKRLTDMCTAPGIVELRKHLSPDSELIPRPFKWILMGRPWYRGRTLLIGDAAHSTTAHLGMGGGMALEDAVVLAQCIGNAGTLADAYEAFMDRRYERVRVVVETSVALSKAEQEGTSADPVNRKRMADALTVLSQPY